MGLLDGEARGVGGGLATDPDGRLIVVGPGGVPIAGGGGGGAPSGTVDITDRAGRVLGTVVVGNWPATQPVSGSVNVGNFPASQPVSGPLTDQQLRAAAVPVAGTFWQPTQPVSGPLTDAQLRAAAVPVSGALTDAQLRAGSVPVAVSNFPATQTTRDLKDAGRTHVLLSVAGVASVTAETFLNLNINQPAGVTTGTTFTVPAGKTLRIQALQFGARFATMSTTVTFANVTFRLRLGSATSSPLLLSDSKASASNAATPNSDLAIPDGLELPAGTVLGVTQQASATTLLLDAILVGFLY